MGIKELFYEDVEIGEEIGPLEKVITDEQVLLFVQVWGRGNRPSRFTDPEVAKKEGLPGTIVPGAMNMAFLSQLLTDWSPNVTLKKLDVVIRQSVLHNSPYHLKGIVTDKSIVDGESRLEVDVFLESPEGERPVGGKAVITLPLKGR